jgi:hypothetical protein
MEEAATKPTAAAAADPALAAVGDLLLRLPAEAEVVAAAAPPRDRSGLWGSRRHGPATCRNGGLVGAGPQALLFLLQRRGEGEEEEEEEEEGGGAGRTRRRRRTEEQEQEEEEKISQLDTSL